MRRSGHLLGALAAFATATAACAGSSTMGDGPSAVDAAADVALDPFDGPTLDEAAPIDAAVILDGSGDMAPSGDAAAAVDGALGVLPDAALDAARDAALDGALVDGAAVGPRTLLLTLDAGAYAPTSAHPSALVYLPSFFDPARPLEVVVFLHGFDNCVENVVRDGGASCNPDAGTPTRQAYALAAQLEASHKQALLLVPELVFDQATGAPGNLGKTGGFRALLDETLADLAPLLGPHTSADVARLVVASHSGGYQAAAGIAQRGGVPVDELYLLDSLYGNVTDFDAWVQSDLPSLRAFGTDAGVKERRFADVYTASGGTLANSQAMADRAKTWLGADAGALVDDRTTSTWPTSTYAHGLLFKESGLPHDGVPRYYFGHLVSTSGLTTAP